jgi:DinB family protein
MNPYRERILGLLGKRNPVESLEATGARVEALVKKIGPKGMSRAYAPGKWTAREILAHLADAEIGVGFRLRQALAEKDHVAQPFDQDKWAERYEDVDGEAAARAFCALRPWNVALIKTLAPADLARPMMHPERGMESVDIIVKMLAGHDLNHVAQLEQIAAQ